MNEIKIKRPWRFSCFVSPGSSGSHRTLQRLTNPTSQTFAQGPTKIVGRGESRRPRWRVGTTNHPRPFRSCLLICRLVKHLQRSSQVYQLSYISPFGLSCMLTRLSWTTLAKLAPGSDLVSQKTCLGGSVRRLTVLIFPTLLLFSPSPRHDPIGKNSLLQVLSLVILICRAGPRLRERVHIFTWFVQLKKHESAPSARWVKLWVGPDGYSRPCV